MKKIFFIYMLLLGGSIQAQQWVTGYYPTWWYGTLAPSAFEMSSLTHLIIFPAQDASSGTPYFNASNMDDGNNMQSLITIAHSKGVKVVASVVGGYGQTNMPVVAADAVKCSTFVVTACAWAKARNFDGIELDWEFPRSTDSKGWNQLIRLFRKELDKWTPKGIFMTSANYLAPSSPPYYVDSMTVFDQINLMSYTMWMGATQESPYYSGYDTPVNPSTLNPKGTSLNGGGVLGWISAGYKASQIGVGMSFESTIFTFSNPANAGLGKSYTSWSFGSVAVNSIGLGYPSRPSSGLWDATAQASYAITTGKAYSYQDTSSVKAIVAFAKKNNFGGVMVWDFPAGHDGVAKDVLLRVLAREAKGTVTSPPIVTITGTLTGSPTALPYGGGYTLLTWTSKNATSAFLNQGIGSVNVNGSITIGLKETAMFILTLSNETSSVSYSISIDVSTIPSTPTINADSIKGFNVGYPLGYIDGAKSVNTDSIFNVGKSVGVFLGMASINKDSIYKAGYDSKICPIQIDTNGLWDKYHDQIIGSSEVGDLLYMSFKKGQASIDTVTPFNNGVGVGIKKGEAEFVPETKYNRIIQGQ
jgi:chitinase